MAIALALDLGTSLVKAGVLNEDGRLEGIVNQPAPKLGGADPFRESDAEEYLAVAERVLADCIARAGKDLPLGLTSQRSSFLLWERKTRKPVTPLISWQDRRAMAWCEQNRDFEPRIKALTGLPLSAHYAGPKLAAQLQETPELRERLGSGELLFGTLECYLIWCWSLPATHATDLTMAARTLLADPQAGHWAAPLLEFFDVPAAALPTILPTRGFEIQLRNGLRLRATIADQAAGALEVFGNHQDTALVNLGTGGFVLRPTGKRFRPSRRYLAGPIFGGKPGQALFAAEGTIHGAGPAVAAFGPGPTDLLASDPSPLGFCLPDVNGVGSPYWLPDVGQEFSKAGEGQTARGKRRLVLEGILFRVRQVLEGLCDGDVPGRIILSGGLSKEPFVAAGLAACLEAPIELLEEPEATLLGAARLAAGQNPCVEAETQIVVPGRQGAYLPSKYESWKEWVQDLLGHELGHKIRFE